MKWAYVAGYFDGEGSVGFHKMKRGDYTRHLTWHNTHRASLEAIREFIGVGQMHARRTTSEWGHKKNYVLQVGRRADVLFVLKRIIPHLIVKREAAESLREYVATRKDESPNFGKVAAVSTEQLKRWYHDEGKSYPVIARLLGGVSPSAIAQAFRVRGIPRRKAGGAFMKGVPKSAATRRRMTAAQRKKWENPEYRERILKVLRSEESRKRRSAAHRSRWQTPEYRERMLKILGSKETRERMSTAQQRRRHHILGLEKSG